MKWRNFARQIIYGERKSDHCQPIRYKNQLYIGIGIDVGLNVSGQTDVLLPEDHPVAAEEHQKPHKSTDTGEHEYQQSNPRPPGHAECKNPHRDAEEKRNQQYRQDEPVIAEHNTEVSRHLRQRGRRGVAGLAWFAEEEKNHEKHGEDAERGNAIDILDAEVPMRPGGEIRTCGAANIHHGVINRIADGAHILVRRTGGCANHAGFHQCDSQSRKYQNKANK